MGMSNIYDFSVEDADGKDQSLSQFQGKLVLIVNTASKCGFTPQYKGLQELYNQWQAQGLEILAFPCNQFGGQEPGDNAAIQDFCELTYGITFPVFAKIDVNGDNSHPLYKYLRSQKGDDIKWNFTKFLVDRNGEVLDRYSSKTTPQEIGVEIEKLLGGTVG
jgi:glutathione peroxidase